MQLKKKRIQSLRRYWKSSGYVLQEEPLYAKKRENKKKHINYGNRMKKENEEKCNDKNQTLEQIINDRTEGHGPKQNAQKCPTGMITQKDQKILQEAEKPSHKKKDKEEKDDGNLKDENTNTLPSDEVNITSTAYQNSNEGEIGTNSDKETLHGEEDEQIGD